MGLFSKKQLLKVIEWEDDSKDTMVYRYPLTDRDEIMNSSTLVVRPSQVALFVHKGQICDVFAPGTYKLATENIPLITKILALPTGFDSPIKAEVYYVNTKQFAGQKWGTQNPIMMRDAEFGAVRLRAFGNYSIKVDNPKKFMEEVFGTNSLFTVNELFAQVKPMVVEAFSDAVAESKISALDLAANYKEFSKTIVDTSVEAFSAFGLKLCSVTIENISLPENVEKALDERSSMGIMKDEMATYTQYQAANAMRDAANNPNGNNMAGMGVGIASGMAMGNIFAQSMAQTAQAQPAPQAAPAAAAAAPAGATCACPNCGSQVAKGTKFCPECGNKMPVAKFCPNCGTKLNDGAKFCPECGEKL